MVRNQNNLYAKIFQNQALQSEGGLKIQFILHFRVAKFVFLAEKVRLLSFAIKIVLRSFRALGGLR